MKRFLAIVALLLTISAPLVQAGTEKGGGNGSTTLPAGDILD